MQTLCGATTPPDPARRRRAAYLKALTSATAVLLLSLPMAPAAMAQSDEAVEDTTLTWSHPQEPPNWNYWATGASALTMPTFHNVLQPLVEQMGNGSVEPLLATDWKISDDELSYTFTLRDAKFHDGTDLDAADVVYSLLKNKESPQGPMRTPLAAVDKLEAVDENTVRLTLSRASQRLLKELGLSAGIIVPEGFHEEHDLASEMIGTGPYVFGAYRPDVDLTLTRFDDYWGDKPFFTEVTHRFISDETAAINALLAGEIDMVATVLGEGLDRSATVAEDAGFKAIIPAPLEMNYLFLSTRNPDFQDIRVRQAIAHSLNREDLLLAAQAGYGETSCQWVIPFTEPWNSDYCPYPYDPEKARELLAEAGQEDLALYFPSLSIAEFPVLKDVIVVYLSEVGIHVESKPLDLATWLEQVNTNGVYDVSNLTTSAKAEAFVCGGRRQPMGMPNSEACVPEFDALVAQSDQILDPEEYTAAMAEMTKAFADSAWVIPTYAKSSPTLSRADLVGHKPYRFLMEMDLRNLRWAD